MVDVRGLTPEHRVVWKFPGAPREVEMGLWEDRDGCLRTDVGDYLRHASGDAVYLTHERIVRVIDPPFTPRVGMVIGRPSRIGERLVRMRDATWLGSSSSSNACWFTDDEARILVEDCGWKVVDDLREGSGDE